MSSSGANSLEAKDATANLAGVANLPSVNRSEEENKSCKSENQTITNHYEKLRKMYHEPSAIRLVIYDLILWGFCVVFDCFFREIRSRGGFKVPKKDSVIFVAAPHANQFVDPVILMSQVKKASGRRISCLIAEKSHRRRFIGLVSRSQLSIPVKRAQDNLVAKPGKITLDPKNDLHIIGENTTFLKDCEPKGLISLPRSLGSAVIGEVLSDSELVLKKPFRFSSEKVELEAKELLKNGTAFKTAAKIDQSEVYAQVFEHLAHGHCIGLFSEGGSHDRPDLLPLKAGVAIMALGAMESTPGLNVKIVPVGMNYFHAHKFRSRAVLEFGNPIEIDDNLIKMFSNPKTTNDAVKFLLDDITKGVKAVTVTCPDFESLSVVQAARRLYSNNLSSQLSISSVVEMNRRLLDGFLHFKDDEKIKQLKDEILKYNETLKSMNVPDHLVSKKHDTSKFVNLIQFLNTCVKISVLSLLALPGIILFSPIFIATKKISEKKRVEALAGSTVKIKGNDVLATWKILIGMGFAPIFYTFYSILGIKIVHIYYPELSRFFSFILFYACSVLVTYSALIFGDKSMDLFKESRALWLMLTNQKGFKEVKEERDRLSLKITEVINEYGPKLYPDFSIVDYEEKLKLKKLSRNERNKRFLERLEKGLSEEEKIEEIKTQELRRRRFEKKKQKAVHNLGSLNIDKKIKLTQDIPIINNDDSSYSAGLSSSEFESSDISTPTSESEFSLNSDSIKAKTLSIIKDKMIKENREREEQN